MSLPVRLAVLVALSLASTTLAAAAQRQPPGHSHGSPGHVCDRASSTARKIHHCDGGASPSSGRPASTSSSAPVPQGASSAAAAAARAVRVVDPRPRYAPNVLLVK